MFFFPCRPNQWSQALYSNFRVTERYKDRSCDMTVTGNESSTEKRPLWPHYTLTLKTTFIACVTKAQTLWACFSPLSFLIARDKSWCAHSNLLVHTVKAKKRDQIIKWFQKILTPYEKWRCSSLYSPTSCVQKDRAGSSPFGVFCFAPTYLCWRQVQHPPLVPPSVF